VLRKERDTVQSFLAVPDGLGPGLFDLATPKFSPGASCTPKQIKKIKPMARTQHPTPESCLEHGSAES
jgi:hypothetical protein